MQVKDIPENFIFVSDTGEIDYFTMMFGWEIYKDYFDSIFIRQENGEITGAYGLLGTIPYRDLDVMLLPL